MAGTHKVIIICQVPAELAETPYEAEGLMREYVKPFRHLVEKLFAPRGDKPTGWFAALRSQLLGW